MKMQAQRGTRRLLAPPSLSGRPMLENVVFPLYSSVALDNTVIPAELNFFGYAKGQNVPGAGDGSATPSTLWHTNMETPGALAQPKVFTVSGIRICIAPFTIGASNSPALSDVSFGAGNIDQDLFEDVALFLWSTVLRFQVGPKVYAHHPSWFFPANVGIGGLSGVGTDNGTAATITQANCVAPHGVGKYFGLPTYPVVIAAQQSFSVQIGATWATNPTINEDRIVHVFLDGTMSREVS